MTDDLPIDRIRSSLLDGRWTEARELLSDMGGEVPDPAALGAERIGGVPRSEPPAQQYATAWKLPAEAGGGVLINDVQSWPRRTRIVEPDATLVLRFGGIGAAVGSVPLDVFRRTAEGETEAVLGLVVDTGPAYYEPELTPEDLHRELRTLLDAVTEATGCEWIPFDELDKEEWDRETFLSHCTRLAEEAGVPPVEAEEVDTESLAMRYQESPAHLTLEAFALSIIGERSTS